MGPVFNEHCNGCGICAAICPCDVFSHDKDHSVPRVLYPDECWYCDACVLDCPGEDGHKGVELRMPLQLQLLWIDPAAGRSPPYEIVGDHLGKDPDTDWDMPHE
jgi:adenylylsulfate reductase subunit B